MTDKREQGVKWKYYFVSYAHPRGFGRIYFKSKPFIDIATAERELTEKYGRSVILFYKEIPEAEFKEANK